MITTNTTAYATTNRAQTIAAIRKALRARSGKAWSVRGGTGTAWGWITISAPPARSADFGTMNDDDRVELASLLDLRDVHYQGVQIPSGHDFYAEYVSRAEGRTPEVYGQRYWD